MIFNEMIFKSGAHFPARLFFTFALHKQSARVGAREDLLSQEMSLKIFNLNSLSTHNDTIRSPIESH